jgi:hypothetical protein
MASSGNVCWWTRWLGQGKALEVAVELGAIVGVELR